MKNGLVNVIISLDDLEYLGEDKTVLVADVVDDYILGLDIKPHMVLLWTLKILY